MQWGIGAVPDRGADRHPQPPDQRAGHHQLEPEPRAALPGHGDHAGRRDPGLVALRGARPGPRPGLAGLVAVLRRERAVPQPAPGVRRPVAGGLPRRPHDGRTAAARLRRGPGADADEFMLPVPSWVHPTWLVCAGLLVAGGGPHGRAAALDGDHHRRRVPGLPRRHVAGAGRHGLPAVGAAARAARRGRGGRPLRQLPGAGLAGRAARHRRRVRRRSRPGGGRPAAAVELVVGRARWRSASHCCGPASTCSRAARGSPGGGPRTRPAAAPSAVPPVTV